MSPVAARSAFRQPIDKSMFNYKRFVGTRVIPEHRTAVISNRKGTLDFRYSVGDPDSYVFTADVYAYMENSHPDRHLGWSRFALPTHTTQAGRFGVCTHMDVLMFGEPKLDYPAVVNTL